MKKLFGMLLLPLLISACSIGGPEPTEVISVQPLASTVTPTQPEPTLTQVPPTKTPTPVFTPTATQPYPDEGYGPGNFPIDINPLTGLLVENARGLDQRPVAVKINIVPSKRSEIHRNWDPSTTSSRKCVPAFSSVVSCRFTAIICIKIVLSMGYVIYHRDKIPSIIMH